MTHRYAQAPDLERIREAATEARSRGLDDEEVLHELRDLGLVVPVECFNCDGTGCAICDDVGVVFVSRAGSS